MRKNRKRLGIALAVVVLIGANMMTAEAGTWKENVFKDGSWTYLDTSEIQKEGWKWIDGNKDGLFECYYQKDNILITNTTVGGYQVNFDGQYMKENKIVQRTLPGWILAVPASETTKYGTLMYPEVTMNDKEIEKSVNGELQRKIKLIKENYMGTEGNEMFSNNLLNQVDYDWILGNDSYISLTLRNASYTGGAHGSTVDCYYTITPDKGILTMDDLGGEALKQDVLAFVRKTLAKEEADGKITLFEQAETITSTFDQNWLLAEDGLHLMFSQYEIAPYAAGIIDVTVPYSELDSLNDYGRTLLGL